MKPTTAQLTILHVAESAGSSALLTLLVGIIQGLATHQVQPAELLTIFGSGFMAAMGLVYKTVRSNPSFAQAETDTASEIKQFIEDRMSALEARFLALFKPASGQSADVPTAQAAAARPVPQMSAKQPPQSSTGG